MELTKGQQVEIRRKQRQWMVFPERLFQLAYDQIPDAPYEFKIRLIESRQQNWPLTNDDIKVLSALANHQSIDPLIVKPSKKRQTSKKVSQAELDSLHQQLKGLIANYQALLGRAEEVGLMPLEKQRRWLEKAQQISENPRATKTALSKEISYLEDQIDRWSDQINRRQLD
ncbi:hypothetical protein LG045_07320 [Limosilactobacillus gastricus]|uniref:Uncharacterized protein n=1 Tax=Limosilactobacillus gastricus DSM 16045 TaxID=1423749 RepID=A0A0R1VD33_9LACO|nr:hypothetical protein [Limosilactobacillus gastricus]KRM03405.1 hypothetical protein FC60_GL000725 [Limosilactobacillus gastricus DSM 16045]QGF40883.1 hypothetical protein LG045_07320 [Limosilactobacillus gastricus]